MQKIFYKKINKLKTKKLSLTSLENLFDHFKLIIDILDRIKKNKNHNLLII